MIATALYGIAAVVALGFVLISMLFVYGVHCLNAQDGNPAPRWFVAVTTLSAPVFMAGIIARLLFDVIRDTGIVLIGAYKQGRHTSND